MKSLIKLAAASLILIILINCSKTQNYNIVEINGLKYYKNTGEPNGKYRPQAKFLFEIKGPENVPDSMKGIGSVTDVIADFNDNIYILDGVHATIKKYNRNGGFERYFPEQRGNGLDQFTKPSQFVLLYDTLLIYDSQDSKYGQFLTSGKYIQTHFSMSGLRPLVLKSDGKTNLSAFFSRIEKVENSNYSFNKLCVLNDRLQPGYTVREIKIKMDENFFFPDAVMNYTAKDGVFYVTENMSDAYRIYVADDRGKMQYIIEKEYKKIPYNQFELLRLNEFIVSTKFKGLDSTKTYYKKAVNTIEIDKNNRLWAQPSLDRTTANQDSFYIDIFDKGVFLNRTVLDFIKGNETYKLEGKRIYVIAEDRKSVRVYDYE